MATPPESSATPIVTAPTIAEPASAGFEYTVRLAVAIPLAWTRLLKETAVIHYDHVCREAGERGVVNGLHNVALWNDDPRYDGDDGKPITLAVSWRDCDCMLKIMEQASYVDPESLRHAIGKWLHDTMDQIQARHREIQT